MEHRASKEPKFRLDLAIVLNGRRGDFRDTKPDMAGIALDALMETGIPVQPFPPWDGDLTYPGRFPNPAFIHNIVQDGITLE